MKAEMKCIGRISYFTTCIIVCLMSYLFSSCSKTQKQTKPNVEVSKPNLLIIIADQWRGQALGFLSEDPLMTPHLDSLARNSLVLTNFISNYPVCSPARAMLMTGKYSFQNHVYSNVTSRSASYNVELSANAVTWSDVLAKNGYSLGYIGKWHLTSPHAPWIPTWNNKGKVKWNEWTPPNERHGFEYWYAYNTYDQHLHPMYWSTGAGRWDFHFVNEWEPNEDVDKAIEFLKNRNGVYREKGQPFGLVVSINPPHTPYTQVPEKYYDLYKNIPIGSFLTDPDIPLEGTKMGDYYRKNIKHYYAAITGDDKQIGRLLGVLKRLKLMDNTIILFVSDHGNNLGKHGKISKNNFYEESLRVPFILYWKGHIKPRIDSICLMSYPDIYPTLLDMMGIRSGISVNVQGQSWASYFLRGNGNYPTSQYFMGHIPPSDSAGGFRGIRTKHYKLVYKLSREGNLKKILFNLKKDPFEMHNIYGQLPKVKDWLNSKLISWLRSTNDPFINNINI